MWDDGAAADAHHALGAQGAGGILLLLVLLVLTAAVASVVTNILTRQAEGARRAISRRAIFDKVEKALKEARTVNGPAQVPAAEHLVRVLDEHLRPAFMLAGGLNDPAGGLRKAIGGRITDPAKPAPALPVALAGGTTPIVIVTGASGAQSGGAASAVATSGGGVSASVSGGGTDVGVIAPAQVYSLPPLVKAPEAAVPTAPVERDMSWKERQDAVQRSLDNFAAFWKRDTVDELLKGAQKALCDVKLPARLPPPPSGR
jgi:hypothetical protein